MFIKELRDHTINISSSLITSNIRQSILTKLYQDVEGATFNNSYILLVLTINNISEGRITNNGDIAFIINYTALSLQLQENTVIETRVLELNQMGLFSRIGPISIFISNHQIPINVKENLMNSSLIRLRVKGVRYNNGLSVVGSLNEEYLGVVL
ncbi:DNA-directed RNA polymerase subunit E' [Pseudoloma neurophilia]|uniref:DNA-directed RNA polymerase subunit E n=1 Tax=Pseudoloma neurophilia TaxID=146866 RepID=A0A0R0M5I1_9MICR|nr:DNA-directed RNA polymerase subunit E' [Pseudoloma neurophilia]